MSLIVWIWFFDTQCRLFLTASDIDEQPFQFIHTIDLSVVDTMLHDSPDLVIHRTENWAVWRPQLGRMKVWRFLTQQFNCCMHVRGAVCRCTVLLKQSRYQILRIAGSSMTSLWRREVSSKKSIRDITKISCFLTTMKFTACIADLFNSFCEEVYAVAFFKVVQQQTIGKVGNSIICLLADNCCLQQWKNYYKNLAAANRSRVSCAHNTLRASIGINITA